MASVTWPSLKPAHWLERLGRRLTGWSRLAGGYGLAGENGLAGLIALVALPAAFVASLSSSLPLALPLALATINLSLAGERAGAPGRAGFARASLAQASLAAALLLVAVFFAVLAVNGTAAALAGVVLSLVFAALPLLLRFLMARDPDARDPDARCPDARCPNDSTVDCRDIEGLDRLMPDERLVVVERDGRIAALSQAVRREFAASGVTRGSDILVLIDVLDRPLLLDALNKAEQREQALSVRLNAEHFPHPQAGVRIAFSLVAGQSRKIVIRLQDGCPQAPDTEQPGRAIAPGAPHADGAASGPACDLDDAARFAVRLLAGDADRQGVGVTMGERSDCGAHALPVGCSVRAARQIALNIIGNAIKFSHAGGQVTVETGGDEEYGVLCVRDRGIGIAERDREALFAPHQRAGDRDRPGSGLGLAIVGDLVAACDGEISLESAPGEGTTVTVRIPLAGMDWETGSTGSHPLPAFSREIAQAA